MFIVIRCVAENHNRTAHFVALVVKINDFRHHCIQHFSNWSFQFPLVFDYFRFYAGFWFVNPGFISNNLFFVSFFEARQKRNEESIKRKKCTIFQAGWEVPSVNMWNICFENDIHPSNFVFDNG